MGLGGVSVDPRSGCNALSPVPTLNLLYELLQLHRKQLRMLQELEHRQLKSCSDLEHLQHNNSRLKVHNYTNCTTVLNTKYIQ